VRLVPRWVQWALGVVVLAVAAGMIVLLAVNSSGGGSATPTPRADAAVLTAYTQALRGPTSEGGRVVQQLMKPSIGEFEQGQVDAATFESRARGWILALQRVKQQLDRISVPPVIASAGPLFGQAMDAYIQAAQIFEQAAAAPMAERTAALDRGRQAGRDADRLYDRAAAVVQRALRAAGLPTDAALPDPSPTPT
jgi:hypothetical protein